MRLFRNMLLVNSLSSPTYLPSSMDRVRSESSAGQASLEQEFHESLRAHSSELYQQQVRHRFHSSQYYFHGISYISTEANIHFCCHSRLAL